LENFSGPYVVKLLGAEIVQLKVGNKQALILMELCPGGHLLDRLLARKGSFLPADSIYRIFGQLVMAVRSMHKARPITIHRDLKLENVLFGQDGCVRLCDFGSCEEGYTKLTNSSERAIAEEKIAKETTQMYRAPEMIDLYMRSELTEKTDIWVGSVYSFSFFFISFIFVIY
jgi:serine/threonine protein kinase